MCWGLLCSGGCVHTSLSHFCDGMHMAACAQQAQRPHPTGAAVLLPCSSGTSHVVVQTCWLLAPCQWTMLLQRALAAALVPWTHMHCSAGAWLCTAWHSARWLAPSPLLSHVCPHQLVLTLGVGQKTACRSMPRNHPLVGAHCVQHRQQTRLQYCTLVQ